MAIMTLVAARQKSTGKLQSTHVRARKALEKPVKSEIQNYKKKPRPRAKKLTSPKEERRRMFLHSDNLCAP